MLKDSLSNRKNSIIEKWFDLIIGTYPDEGAKYFKNNHDPFQNPVGNTFQHEIIILFDQFLGEMNEDKINRSLDNIIRIRSIQTFSPSRAVIFIFLLKKAIEDELEVELREKQYYKELLYFYTKIDRLAQMAFDIYLRCRENIYDIRLNEIKKQSLGHFGGISESKKQSESNGDIKMIIENSCNMKGDHNK